MTASKYRITVSGLIGQMLTSAFPGFTADVVHRHHIVLVSGDDAACRLLSVIGRLAERGIEVDQVTARYRDSRRPEPEVHE
jgi:hypothetical protein